MPRTGTRPTSDRVRQALFDRLSPELPGSDVLDLYAGSGSLGIEALSRGAARATFVEAAPAAVRVLRQNLDGLGVTERADVRPLRVARALRILAESGRTFDLVLADPPYDLDARDELSRVAGMLRPGGCLILERSARSSAGQDWAGLCEERTVRYGETVLRFFRPDAMAHGSAVFEACREEDAHARGVSGHV